MSAQTIPDEDHRGVRLLVQAHPWLEIAALPANGPGLNPTEGLYKDCTSDSDDQDSRGTRGLNEGFSGFSGLLCPPFESRSLTCDRKDLDPLRFLRCFAIRPP